MAERNLTHEAEATLRRKKTPEAGQRGSPRDVGRTSGGGSLGHKQPRDVADETNIRNEPSRQREDEPAQGDLQR